ncbi:o-succinylbenzoate--CoA ligase [Bacillus gobiensis]|uniref:o-succinylbenzoate--CoA ligase n=1 Tax=Bacillus gobiensis TaxID=1441095 RepID=UPI003D221378
MQVQPNWLKQRSELTPDRTAIIFANEHLTFFELYEKARNMAFQLQTFIRAAERNTIAILLENHIETVIFIHACFLSGCKLVLLNTRLTKAERDFQIKNSQASLLVTEEKWLEDHRQNCETVLLSHLKSLKADDGDLLFEIVLAETATIMYTSGTTGSPKGVEQTFGNHYFSAVSSALNLGLSDHDKWLIALPLFHISGLSALFKSVIYGMPVILHKRFETEEINRSINEHRVTMISVVQTMLTQLVQSVNRSPESLRCVLLGGGPAPLKLLEDSKQKDFPVYQSYGMTETSSQIVTLPPEYSLAKLGSAGKPLFSCEIKIMKDGKPCEPNEHGEITVKGPNVMKSYFHNQKATEQSFQNGWFLTGDMGYLDDEGFLYVLDRRSDLIISGGENIYPAEVEAVLLAHPSVKEAGVTGTEDDRWGKVPCAFIVRRSWINEEELLEHCKKKLAKYKIPKQIYFVDELPRNASNKLLRNKLKNLL